MRSLAMLLVMPPWRPASPATAPRPSSMSRGVGRRGDATVAVTIVPLPYDALGGQAATLLPGENTGAAEEMLLLDDLAP